MAGEQKEQNKCPVFQDTGENSPIKRICRVLNDKFGYDYDEMLEVLNRIIQAINIFKKDGRKLNQRQMCDRCKKIYQAENFLGEDFTFRAYWHNKEGYENETFWVLCSDCIKSFEKWIKIKK